MFEIKNNLPQLFKKYLRREDVSNVTLVRKKQYWLASLQELRQRFQVDESVKCSCTQFTCYVPENSPAKIRGLRYISLHDIPQS